MGSSATKPSLPMTISTIPAGTRAGTGTGIGIYTSGIHGQPISIPAPPANPYSNYQETASSNIWLWVVIIVVIIILLVLLFQHSHRHI